MLSCALRIGERRCCELRPLVEIVKCFQYFLGFEFKAINALIPKLRFEIQTVFSKPERKRLGRSDGVVVVVLLNRTL